MSNVLLCPKRNLSRQS